MVTLWYTQVKLKMKELEDVPARYYDDVFARLKLEGFHDEEGKRIVKE